MSERERKLLRSGHSRLMQQRQRRFNSNTTIPTEGSAVSPRSILSLKNEDLERVSASFRFGTTVAFVMFLSLSFFVFQLTQSYGEAPSTRTLEQQAHWMTSLLLLVTMACRLTPILLRDGPRPLFRNGVLIGSIVVQAMTIASNFLMATVATPVVVDPITGFRVYLLRWAASAPLAFLMTFLTVNLDRGSGRRVCYREPISLAISASFGLVFPFCSNFETWISSVTTAAFFFLPVYGSLYGKTLRLFASRREREQVRTGTSDLIGNAHDKEMTAISTASYNLGLSCAVTWSILGFFFAATGLACVLTSNESGLIINLLAHESAQEVGFCVCEVASKIWYFHVLSSAYEVIFDETAQAARRLDELRSFMHAVWESSTDIIVFCGKHGDDILSVRLSRAYLEMVGLSARNLPVLSQPDISLLLEIAPAKKELCIFSFDTRQPSCLQDVAQLRERLNCRTVSYGEESSLAVTERILVSVAKFAAEAIGMRDSGKGMRLVKGIAALGSDDVEITIQTEAKVTKLDGDSTLLVVRDISDRIQRLEAEKQLRREVAVRKKDAETNKFSRHEIKNGVLAAIALLDHLRDSVDRGGSSEATHLSPESSTGSGPTQSTTSEEDLETQAAFTELDSTLRDMLDSVLDQAMARDIVDGKYIPRKEPLTVSELLRSLLRRGSMRFPMILEPINFPKLLLDKQLLRYIFRNAISNACKYGLWDGVVETVVRYCPGQELFELEVINLPGDGHEDLILLQEEDVAGVFSPETQLSATQRAEGKRAQMIRRESSGNGAWIMQRCAEALGGKCTIRFEKNRTVFRFACPAEAQQRPHRIVQRTLSGSSTSADDFCLPDGTVGIVIDDSAIQRKMMRRFLKMAGIGDGRRHILGKDAGEVLSLSHYVQRILSEHPDDKVLLIVDENLDIADGNTTRTVSGSVCVKKLLEALDQSAERRLLALIRSANDSTEDLARYEERSHGFLLKEPMDNKSQIMQALQPWWKKRFAGLPKSSSSVSLTGHFEAASAPPSMREDIREALDSIDALLCVNSDSVLIYRWRAIREMLHALKGDLKSMYARSSIAAITDRIDQLVLCDKVPEDLIDHFGDVRSQTEALLQ